MTDDSTLTDFLAVEADDGAEGGDENETELDATESEDDRGDGPDTRSESDPSTDDSTVAPEVDADSNSNSNSNSSAHANSRSDPGGQPNTGLSTYAWGNYVCHRCGDETDRVWREDDRFVCPDCKSW
ncbi:DUF7573 domain-containing protein [Natronolimnohabitans innermongolicus]|uniref:DUF7573 domain-containing protein n=1 Tax=Natronolimnohabitans innermongolicus JCM 12255 TaxID=1227499 RepID=L9WXT9_9EURY|nr:hypothetical protein [Natronolimnohabitans innermongolicus]ELY54290.1 hypothetical protein C493_12824 [Natronolimnohabitans innermongolicus JCM 12255]